MSFLHHGGQAMKKPTELNDKVDSLQLLRELGYTAYSLGPIYAYAGVSEDIEEQFLKEKFESGPADPALTALVNSGAVQAVSQPVDTYGTILQCARPAIARCESWNMMLGIMDTSSFRWFKKWMLGNTYVSRARKTYAVPRHYLAPVMDPLAFVARGTDVPETLDVFSVHSVRWSLVPVTNVVDKRLTPTFIELEVKPPDEDVRVEGAKILGMIKDL